MFEGYPENAFGLRVLQEEIRADVQKRLGKAIGLGELIILSQSAHLYRDTWEWAEKVTQANLPPYMRHMSRLDPKGNFIISLDREEIVLEHTGPGGEKIGEFRGRSGSELRDIMARENVVSLIPHAIDLGLEIMKAEMAKKLGMKYVQDQPLDLPAKQRPALKVFGPIDSPFVSKVTKTGIVQTQDEQTSYKEILHKARMSSMGV